MPNIASARSSRNNPECDRLRPTLAVIEDGTSEALRASATAKYAALWRERFGDEPELLVRNREFELWRVADAIWVQSRRTGTIYHLPDFVCDKGRWKVGIEALIAIPGLRKYLDAAEAFFGLRKRTRRIFLNRLVAALAGHNVRWAMKLPPDARMVVHHINEITWDDRIENLEVMTFAQHEEHHGGTPWGNRMHLRNGRGCAAMSQNASKSGEAPSRLASKPATSPMSLLT